MSKQIQIGKINYFGNFIISVDGVSHKCSYDKVRFRCGQLFARSAKELAQLIAA